MIFPGYLGAVTRRLWRWVLASMAVLAAALGAAGAGAGTASASTGASAPAVAQHVVIVGISGLRWTDVSASRLCDRLEAAGFLYRVSGTSRRAIMLRLSPEGRDLLDRLRRQRREDLSRVLARMPPAARTALATGLAQFRTAAGKSSLTSFTRSANGLLGPT